MSGLPGSIQSLMPDAPYEITRRMRDLERRMDESGPSVARSFKPVIDDLTAKQAALEAQQATLAATVADLASRVSVTATIPTVSAGGLPNDATYHNYGADIPITIAVPTGKLTVTVGCGKTTTNSSMTGSVYAQATFSISGGIANYGDVYAEGETDTLGTITGTSLSVQHAFTVPPGTYTIIGKMRAMASGTGVNGAYFYNPYLTVQVTG